MNSWAGLGWPTYLFGFRTRASNTRSIQRPIFSRDSPAHDFVDGIISSDGAYVWMVAEVNNA